MPKSETGHLFGGVRTSFALPLKADLSWRERESVSCPTNEHGGLFDRFVGTGQEGGWDCQADFPSGLQIDD